MQASNIKSLKSDNRALILNEIRKCPHSRAQLSDATSLTRSAVTMIVQDLIAEGQICETRSLQTGRGRKQILLEIVADHKYALGLALHRHETAVVLTDLSGKALEHKSTATSSFSSAGEILEWSRSSMQGFLNRRRISSNRLVGIGISSPGPLDLDNGKILAPIDFDMFHNFPVVDHIRNFEFELLDGKIKFPDVSLDNNAVLLAMREYYQCESKMHQFKHILYVTVSRGIGSCLISNGQIYRGFGGFAGELGHTSIEGTGRPCTCGNYGCLERYATLDALKEFFGFDNYEVIVDLAYNGIGRPLAIVEQIAEWLSTALVNAVNLFDLDAIVLYGELNYRPKLLTDLIQSRIRQRSLVGRVHEVQVMASVYDDKTAALSATSTIIDSYFKCQRSD